MCTLEAITCSLRSVRRGVRRWSFPESSSCSVVSWCSCSAGYCRHRRCSSKSDITAMSSSIRTGSESRWLGSCTATKYQDNDRSVYGTLHIHTTGCISSIRIQILSIRVFERKLKMSVKIVRFYRGKILTSHQMMNKKISWYRQRVYRDIIYHDIDIYHFSHRSPIVRTYFCAVRIFITELRVLNLVNIRSKLFFSPQIQNSSSSNQTLFYWLIFSLISSIYLQNKN